MLALAMSASDDVSARGAAMALLTAAQRGDEAAQAELFETHKRAVARQVLRMTGNPGVVDDLVQEVFIAAFSALPGFRGDAQLQTWLHTITVNKVRSYWDSHRRRRLREERAGDQTATPPATPEEAVERSEHIDKLYSAMAALPDPLREAFTLRAIERMSLKQVSALLDIPISTVSYRTRRAEALLCASLDIPYEGDA